MFILNLKLRKECVNITISLRNNAGGFYLSEYPMVMYHKIAKECFVNSCNAVIFTVMFLKIK